MSASDERKTAPVVHLGMPLERIVVAHHSGPGLRLIFWVQGCSLRCTRNCLNPHLLSQTGGYPVPAGELAGYLQSLARDYREVEGVTVLGGEPFDQAFALAQALSPMHAAGLSVMVYTGHVLETLRQSPEPGIGCLLDLCDLLVDGPFLDAQIDTTLIWRGSSNQRILQLSDRYTEGDLERAMAAQGRASFVSRPVAAEAVVSGAQSIETARRLRVLARELASRSERHG